MKVYGLIGYPLEHSFSKTYFNEKFEKEKIPDSEYRNFPLQNISGILQLLGQTTGLCGLNVTIPHKEQVVQYLNELDPVAKEIGAVNTISFTKVHRDIYLKGYNTDVFGFGESLHPLLNPSITKALVLGTGGASKAVRYVLQQFGIPVLMVSRSKSSVETINYASLTGAIVSDHKLIVNTTPLGTFPAIEAFPPIPYEAVTAGHILYDLVYNPSETVFLAKGKARGAVTKNGYDMLVLQAEKSWEIWRS